ncbi:Zinc finger C2H2 protein [Astathelohania contejeani]|uniref:Zinc finger C2H2 protein n=1 Tax=Astathelohania contejeani TaxID=164912 RepID=A0ABQ7HWV9_9MICR|nr:Zinc finger C2H2 protein [Thelohania contejeani]
MIAKNKRGMYKEKQCGYIVRKQNLDIESKFERVENKMYNNELTDKQLFNEVEKEFMDGLVCCGLSFDKFFKFYAHYNSVHKLVEKEQEEVVVEELEDEEEYEVTAISEETECYEKPYKCTVEDCMKSYTSAYGLRYHMEKGHNCPPLLKPYACTVEGCEKRYRNSMGLKYHLIHGHNQNNEI